MTFADDGDQGGNARNQDNDNDSVEEQRRMGEILKDVSEEEADLLVQMLAEFGLASIDGDVLTIYPGGIPANRIRMGAHDGDRAAGQDGTSQARHQCCRQGTLSGHGRKD
jgi:hypothetical protein